MNMLFSFFIKKISITLALSLSFFSLPAIAHFHYELNVKSVFQANENNQLESMKITWVYDDEVSMLMLQDQNDVKKLGQKLIKDLETLAYFTALKLNGKEIETKKVESFKLEEVKQNDYSNLKLTFTLPFKTPIRLTGNSTFDINHEDGTASAIIYYEDVNSLAFDESLNSNCKAKLTDKQDFEEGESPQNVQVVCVN